MRETQMAGLILSNLSNLQCFLMLPLCIIFWMRAVFEKGTQGALFLQLFGPLLRKKNKCFTLSLGHHKCSSHYRLDAATENSHHVASKPMDRHCNMPQRVRNMAGQWAQACDQIQSKKHEKEKITYYCFSPSLIIKQYLIFPLLIDIILINTHTKCMSKMLPNPD